MAKQFTGNAKSFGHIHPLMKRTDWNEYKRNYDQNKIQYSQWAKGGSVPNASKLQSAISWPVKSFRLTVIPLVTSTTVVKVV